MYWLRCVRCVQTNNVNNDSGDQFGLTANYYVQRTKVTNENECRAQSCMMNHLCLERIYKCDMHMQIPAVNDRTNAFQWNAFFIQTTTNVSTAFVSHSTHPFNFLKRF